MSSKIIRFALCAVLFAFCSAAEAQQPAKIPKIGELIFTSGPGLGPGRAAFRQQLRELGYVEGKNISLRGSVGRR